MTTLLIIGRDVESSFFQREVKARTERYLGEKVELFFHNAPIDDNVIINLNAFHPGQPQPARDRLS